MDSARRLETPLGGVLLAGDGEALTGLWFEGQRYFARTLDGHAGDAPAALDRCGCSDSAPAVLDHCGCSDPAPAVLDRAERWLAAYFRGEDPGEAPPLAPRGTEFQRAVWALLTEIPRGQTATYGQIAARLAGRTGAAVSARAVGGAVARNPISIFIPCHRVVGADGGLIGYAGGIDRKRQLLRLEGAISDSGGNDGKP